MTKKMKCLLIHNNHRFAIENEKNWSNEQLAKNDIIKQQIHIIIILSLLDEFL